MAARDGVGRGASMKPGFLLRFQHAPDSTVIRVKAHEDSTVSDMLDVFNQFLLAVGYSPASIADNATEWAAELRCAKIVSATQEGVQDGKE